MITDYDLHLLGEGRHWQSYRKLGAHPVTEERVSGVHFAVWAPNADAVSVVGDFNDWDGRRTPLERRGSGGIWAAFVPGIGPGAIYKYRIVAGGTVSERSDPYGFGAELPPRTASCVGAPEIELARVLTLIAASEASHLPYLTRLAGGQWP